MSGPVHDRSARDVWANRYAWNVRDPESRSDESSGLQDQVSTIVVGILGGAQIVLLPGSPMPRAWDRRCPGCGPSGIRIGYE